jgi:hypothetical protein
VATSDQGISSQGSPLKSAQLWFFLTPRFAPFSAPIGSSVESRNQKSSASLTRPRRMQKPPTANRKITPPELARRYGIGAGKVLMWIRSGELRAVNVATRPKGRPRYVIDDDDIAAFEARRALVPTPKPSGRRRTGKKSENVIDFY